MAKGSCHRESPRGTGVILHRLQDALHDFAGLVGGGTPLREPPRARTAPQPPTVVAQLRCGGSRWVLVVVPGSGEPELSDREWEVALLVARGATNKAIAGELGLEAPTVATHIRHIYSKWDLRTRVDLVLRVLGRRPDIIESPPRSRRTPGPGPKPRPRRRTTARPKLIRQA